MKRLSFVMLALLLPAGCQSSGAGGSSGGVPQAAIDACLRDADAYQNAAAGTATYSGVAEADVAADTVGAAGKYWRLRVAVAGVAMACTVTPAGSVQSIDPL
jgi:hypothetical protein